MITERLLERMEDSTPQERKRIQNLLNALNWIKRGAVGFIGAVGLYSSLYTIPNDSAGVVKTLGAYSRTAGPGIHAKWFYPIEELDKVPIKKVQKEEFGFRTLKPGIDTQYIGTDEILQGKISDSDLEAMVSRSGETASTDRTKLKEQAKEILKSEYLMLTGDLNMADIEFIVQYDIKDPVKYLFNIREPKMAIRDSANSVMRQLIGNGSVDEAISVGRIENEDQSKVELQRLLDGYDTGINIITVKLQSTHPPRNVRPSFHEVNSAMQMKEQKINEAKKDYNESVPKAIGQAQGLIESAKGYAKERVNTAEGDASKFNQLQEEYTKSPEVTMRRMHLETMNKILPQIKNKWIVEQEGESGLLKLLHLPTKIQEDKEK